jgi:hypothetical protein
MEAAVKFPHFTISSLMALVLLVALDVWACKALLMGGPLFVPDLSDLLVFVALPMANILAIGLYPFLRSRHEQEGNRPGPGLVGFEVGGLAALLIFLACSVTMTHPLHEGVGHLLTSIGLVPGPVFLVGAATFLLLPQVALALVGARLARTYRFRVRLIVERREIPGPESGPTPEHLVAEGM